MTGDPGINRFTPGEQTRKIEVTVYSQAREQLTRTNAEEPPKREDHRMRS